MSLDFDVRGIAVSARMPTLAEMTTALNASRAAGSASHDGMRDLVRAVVPKATFESLKERRPACFRELGSSIMLAAGFSGGVTLFEEAELDNDEEFAAALAKAEEKVPAAYKQDPDDDRARLFPITFTVGDETRKAIFRFPYEREIAAVRKGLSFENFKVFTTSTCVWGDMASLESTAPGTYHTLTEFLLEQAGEGQATRLGK